MIEEALEAIKQARRREDIVASYADLIRGGRFADRDVRRLNAEIVERWSNSGLEYVKRLAWRSLGV